MLLDEDVALIIVLWVEIVALMELLFTDIVLFTNEALEQIAKITLQNILDFSNGIDSESLVR